MQNKVIIYVYFLFVFNVACFNCGGISLCLVCDLFVSKTLFMIVVGVYCPFVLLFGFVISVLFIYICNDRQKVAIEV